MCGSPAGVAFTASWPLSAPTPLVSVEARGVEAQADWEHLETPETYLGYLRGTGFVSSERVVPDEPHAFELTQSLPLNHWALTGEWTIGPERITLERAGGSIAFRFHARDAHLVLSPGAREPIPFRVRVDGGPPGPAAGVDIDEDGHGVLEHGRMYQLVRQRDAVHDRTLEIAFLEPGAEAYAFTFG